MNEDTIRKQLKSEEERLIDLRDDFRSVEGLNDTQVIDASHEHVGAELHPAEVATEFVQKEIDLSMLEHVESEISDVERALERLDAGTYGQCESCSEQIPRERLEALPAARFCLSCETAQADPSVAGHPRDVLRHLS